MEFFNVELWKVGVPLLAFILGVMVSRFTFTRKEKHDIETQKVKTSGDLAAEQEKAFQEFCAALQKYASAPGSPSLDDFFSIATSGEKYFNRLKITCDAILAGRVDDLSVKNTHRPAVMNAVNKTLPEFYNTLREIARKNNIVYYGCLQRSNYMSIYQVYESNSL